MTTEAREKIGQRLDYNKLSPEGIQAAMVLETFLTQKSGLDPKLIHLIKLRASLINGCAFCINMHTLEAKKAGETDQRIRLLSAWREVPFYTEKERAALAWTDALTLISQTHAPDDVFEQVRGQFSDTEVVNLTLAVSAINTWNRIAISMRAQPPLSHV